MNSVLIRISLFISFAFLLLPIFAIFFYQPFGVFLQNAHSVYSLQALLVSIKTTTLAEILILFFGTPVAYFLAKYDAPFKKSLEVALQMPLVIPPAVAGLGLLLVFGSHGWIGELLFPYGVSLAFTTEAVILAQIFVAAPLYIILAKQAFGSVDDELIAVSQTLGVNTEKTFWRITLPLSFPGLLSGLALSWARALGEFGATIMFAGNLTEKTQTLPLAIYTSLESDLAEAVAIAGMLLVVTFFLLFIVLLIDKK